VLPLLASVCDKLGEIVIVPEFEMSFSFEAGLGSWVPGGLDLVGPSVVWSASSSSEEASDGDQSVRVYLDNLNGQGKIWISRELEVAPHQRYDIDISFELATADASADAWQVIAGAHTAPPESAAELSFRGATAAAGADGGELAWVTNQYAVQGQADGDGLLYILVGIWGTGPGARTYYVDDVRLVLTRR
jgi:hypothetical protein